MLASSREIDYQLRNHAVGECYITFAAALILAACSSCNDSNDGQAQLVVLLDRTRRRTGRHPNLADFPVTKRYRSVESRLRLFTIRK